jgi:transcriptional regulator with XRE-family HTH domain
MIMELAGGQPGDDRSGNSGNRNGVMAAGGRSPLMRRRRLAAELHRLRAASRMTLEEVADHLECSPAKISRIENGQVAVRIQDARELLDLYDVDEQQREPLLQMVRQARGKGWWSDYADLLDEAGQTLLSLEDEASAILVYETNLITALLQTRRYAWELISSRSDSRLELVQRAVDLRMARQHILDRPNAPRLSVVLDEASLRRTVSSRDVMREQYELLADTAARPNISLRVLLFGAGAHQAMGFPFQIFEFLDDDPQLVSVELLSRREILESAEEVGRYRAAFNQVNDRALPPEESRNFLLNLVKEYGKLIQVAI